MVPVIRGKVSQGLFWFKYRYTGEHQRSVTGAFAVRRHVEETLRKFQAKTHLCSPKRGTAHAHWKNINWKTTRFIYHVPARLGMFKKD